jgi:hypothetical protein
MQAKQREMANHQANVKKKEEERKGLRLQIMLY